MEKKYRLLGLLICLCIVVVLFPVTAFATEYYGLWINGIQVTSDNAANILTNESVSYNPDTNTLTLNNANLTQIYTGSLHQAAIYADNTIPSLKINVTGQNTITVDSLEGIYAMNAIEFTGSGSLNVSVTNRDTSLLGGEAYAVYSHISNVTITSGIYSFYAYGTVGYGIMANSNSGTVTVNGGNTTFIGDGSSLGTAIGGDLDFSNYDNCVATASFDASGDPEVEYDEANKMYYKYIKIQPPTPLEYDENGFTADKKHYEPANLSDDGWYEIKNAGNLYWFSQFLKESDNNAAANARLTQNITIPEGMNWLPMEVGFYGIPYQGIFDGGTYTISNLTLRFGPSDFYTGAGLFETLGENAIVKNLGMINTDINITSGTAGAICGTNNGTIENCYNTGTINADIQYAGGIVGMNYGTIKHCYNTGEISVAQAYGSGAGGICGNALQNAIIENCYNTGTIKGNWGVGGICGYANEPVKITNCYNTGTLTADSFSHGIAFCWSNTGVSVADWIENCYYLANLESTDGGKTSAQFASGEVAYLLNRSTSEGNLVWGQTIGGEKAQPAPIFNGSTVYAGYEFCYSQDISYGNDKTKLFETKPQHNIGGAWQADDASGHWQVCQNEGCTQKGTVIAHTPADQLINMIEPTASKEGYTGDTVCSECGWVISYGKPIDKLPPSITDGGNTEHRPGESSSFTSDASIEDFVTMKVDGTEVPNGSYIITYDENGTHITLTPEYMKTLSYGDHTVEIIFKTGTVKTKFTIEEPFSYDSTNESTNGATQTPSTTDKEPDISIPSTSDNSNLFPAILLFVISSIGLAGMIIYKRKNSYSK